MATIKVKFRPSPLAGHEGTIYYQITHERKQRQLFTDFHLFSAEWDEKRSMVISTQRDTRFPYVLSIREHIRCDLNRFNRIIRKFDSDGAEYSAHDIAEEFVRHIKEYSLFNYMEGLIIKLKQNGKIRTSETYSSTLNSFKKFLANRPPRGNCRESQDIMLDCINSDIMEAYESWQQQRGLVLNTISFYTRILRAVYNRAVEEEIIENRHPFRHVYTGIDKTVKRAIPLKKIKQIKDLDLSLTPSLDFARDMFVLSFMFRGMSFIDMAFLKKSDLTNGYLTYRRRKTGQQLTIEWTGDMQAILDKYKENASVYLLPIIRKPGTNERCTYRNMSYNINRSLKMIAQMVGVTIPLSLYVARHSWASAAKAKGIPLSVISEGMGHDSEATTQIYLASLDTSMVDKANSLLMQSLQL